MESGKGEGRAGEPPHAPKRLHAGPAPIYPRMEAHFSWVVKKGKNLAELKQFERVAIDALKPYQYNAKKHPKKQIHKLQASIEEFGFISPILIDADNNVIAGHGRLEAAKGLYMDEVPCVRVEGLTEEQRRAYIIADNKLCELGGWDKDLVSAELQTLDVLNFNIDVTGFDIDSILNDLPDSTEYGDERERTLNAVNFHDFDGMRSYPPYDIPVLESCDVVPDDMIGFNYVLSSKKESDFLCGVHFFIDDYQFERIWNSPEKYIEKLKKFQCVCTPDFSPYADMPNAMKIWNVYRNRMIGQMMQDAGINVIPTITWSDESTFDYVINGVKPGGTVAISTVSISKLKSDEQFRKIFQKGIDLVIERMQPKTIILYGSKEIDIDTKGVAIKRIKPHVFEKDKGNKKNG